MKMRSTGLGKTELTAHATDLLIDPENASRLCMKIESTEPVHWYITAFLEGKDMRQMVWMVLRKPVFLFKAFILFLKG
jgi:hypothetical protein